MNASAGLFRKEVLEERAARLHGDVNLAVPISWQAIGFILLSTVVVTIVFLVNASYARVEVVTGAIVLDLGEAAITPSRSGTIAGLSVREGQSVRAGEVLAHIRSEEDMAGGQTTPSRILEALQEQDQRLANQTELMREAAREEQRRLAAQRSGTAQEIASLDNQIIAQMRLIEVSEREFRDVQIVAGKGFISRRDLESREASLITRRQQLSQLEQVRSAKQAELAQSRRAILQAGAAAEAQAAGVFSTRAQLSQRVAEVQTAQGYTLTSPVSGTVTALTARLGQPATQQQPLMIVMPTNAVPRVELYVPTNAAGFLRRGQEVRLAIDAFPYQRFGTVTARISQISSVATPRTTSTGGAVPVYLVTADLADATVAAFGRKQPLLPGMALTARIVTERQTLMQWLFEPLFAVSSR